MEASGKKLTKTQTKIPDIFKSHHEQPSPISISFRFFKQIDNFGLKDIQSTWFVGLFQRLRDICTNDIDLLFTTAKQTNLKIHNVDWTKSALKKEDLIWIPKYLRDENCEIPIQQISISRANGRIIFFMLESVMYIILLDREHNMQLCKYTDYKVRRSFIEESEIDNLRSRISKIKEKGCKGMRCPLDGVEQNTGILLIEIDKDLENLYENEVDNGTLISDFQEFLTNKFIKQP